MLKRALALTAFVLTMLCLLACAYGEESFFAYYGEERWIRREPVSGSSGVAELPANTVVKLTPVNGSYAAVSYNGKDGYLYYPEANRVDMTDPMSPDAVWVEGSFEEEAVLRRAPLKNSSRVTNVPAGERVRATAVNSTYLYLEYGGKSGYALREQFAQTVYPSGIVLPYIVYAKSEVVLYNGPYADSAAVSSLKVNTPTLAVGYDGESLLVQQDGALYYAPAQSLTVLEGNYDTEDFDAALASAADILEYPLTNARVIGRGKKKAAVTVHAFFGEYAYLTCGSYVGYVHYSKLQATKNTKDAMDAMQRQILKQKGRRYLEIAFQMLEEDNPILQYYNRYCQGNAVARFRYGCPYFYGGYNENILLKVYRTWQNSHYYLMSNRYLGGFDCIGFARWVHTTAGDATLPAISKVRSDGRNNLVDVGNLPYDEWQNVLLAGDCVNIAYSGGGYHIGIYIGTLREFGFTEEDVGEPLAPYMDRPLIIHCGMNNFHTEWYAKYLKENGLSSVTPPDGGVTISVMGVDFENCPYTETMWQGTANVKTFYWFDLMGYNLTVINPIGSNVRWMAVYRSK